MLYLYDIITDRDTYYIQRLLDQNWFKDGEDYKIINPNVGLNYKTVGRPSINYFLKPKTFKMCLMRSLKTKKYALYYLFLEEVISLFSDFQIQKLQTDLFIANNRKVMALEDKSKYDQICIIKRPENPKYKYKEIRGQLKHINKVIKENDLRQMIYYCN